MKKTKPFAAFSANELIGAEVRNADHDHLGAIEDIVLSNSGGVAYLVLSYGGIFGSSLGDKRFAVPFGAFTIAKVEKGLKCLLNIDKHYLEQAPGFAKGNPPHFAAPSFPLQVDTYYQDYVRTHKVV